MRIAILALSSLILISCSSSSTETSAPATQAPAAQAPAAAPTDADAKAFIDKAASEPGSQRTASGLVFKDIKQGTGAHPTANDTVKVNYRGTLINGTEFDSSYKRNEPISFPLRNVIPCWTEGVQMMKVGGKAQLICPSNLAYGPASPSPLIPPNSTLVFEVELLAIGG